MLAFFWVSALNQLTIWIIRTVQSLLQLFSSTLCLS